MIIIKTPFTVIKQQATVALTSLLLASVILLILPTLANAQDNYAEATALFAQQDYQSALNLFLTEERKGKSDKSLQYNIAVCYYKLDQWQQANHYFKTLYQQYPDDYSVAYSLAITQKKLGSISKAKNLFLTLASSNNPYAAAAKIQYQQLNNTSVIRPTEQQNTWINGANITAGSDNNVINPSDVNASERSDTFIETLLTSSWENNQGNSLSIDGLAYFSRYSDVTDYDISLLNLGIKKMLPTSLGNGL
jgi:tetratricopeptide (TPR) repeat protein